ncbi:MAG: Fe-S cluster assembly protein SufD [Candidatus Eisenbacteria bacterium]
MSVAVSQTNDWAAAYARRDSKTAPAWLTALRREAWERFGLLGMPHVRLEDWRFTNPAPITQAVFVDAGAIAPQTASGLPAIPAFGSWDRIEVALVGGRYDASLAHVPALPGGAWVGGLASALANPVLADGIARTLGRIAQWQERAFVALNTALIEDGVLIHVAPGVTLETVVRVSYAAPRGGEGPVASHPRVLVIADRGSRVVVVEDFRASQAAGDLVNPVIEFDVREGATVEHVSLLGDVPGSLHTGAAFARIGAGARFASRSIALGGRLTRRDVHVTFAGEGAEIDLDGLYVCAGDDLVDHHTVADHAVPRCTSRELFKGVLAGRSRAVFNGAVIIRPDAQQSDARQQNQNLLLSEDAMINTKPELQIFADDVKCAHGATVGQLDDDALFYLRARGIDPQAARAMLTHAFARSVVDRVSPPALRAEIDAVVEARMESLAAGATS